MLTVGSCPGQTFSANLKMYLDADVEMEATYAYYFSGTILPPHVTDTYAYFGLEPSAYLGLRLTGNAQLQATTGRKKLFDTISYPGLSIKGIAAVGPTLDLYGEVREIVIVPREVIRLSHIADSRQSHAERRDESWCEGQFRKGRSFLASRRRRKHRISKAPGYFGSRISPRQESNRTNF